MHALSAERSSALGALRKCALAMVAWTCALAIAPVSAAESAAEVKPARSSKARPAEAVVAAESTEPADTGRALSKASDMPARKAGLASRNAMAARVNEGSASAVRKRGNDARDRVDPLDRLREKLAQRLGAGKSDDGQVRLAVHSPAPSAAAQTAKSAAARGVTKHSARKSPNPAHAIHWSYQGEGGPQNWAQLKPEFAKCANGERQSPIDIRDGLKLQLDPVLFEYRPSSFRVIDNGHTVQVNVAAGNSIEVMGRRFGLVQFHFHRPSEERIDGRQFDMVAHLVHKDLEGRLAVVAVLLDRGSAHPLVQTVWNNLPLEKGEEVAVRAPLDLNALLPSERGYFTYMGSLTTPPCSEGVLWLVMKEPVQISADQVAVFSRLYPMNARPIQAASGRLIKESN